MPAAFNLRQIVPSDFPDQFLLCPESQLNSYVGIDFCLQQGSAHYMDVQKNSPRNDRKQPSIHHSRCLAGAEVDSGLSVRQISTLYDNVTADKLVHDPPGWCSPSRQGSQCPPRLAKSRPMPTASAKAAAARRTLPAAFHCKM